ncbi:hypothetical protein [Streptomyces sp. NPDC026092]|uniref:hypothetical protein n=1 Tax=Streptomyces sp. NPDC026092 TaxID=3154797 RepID=UPI0033C035F5
MNKPAGVAGDFTVSYYKYRGSNTTVTLGAQFKTPKGTVHPTDWIATKTAVTGKYASATRYYTTNPDWCVRGVMKSGETTYITKWLCY